MANKSSEKKKPVKKEKKSFKTRTFGFDKAEVNIYIAKLKKEAAALEKENQELSARLGLAERGGSFTEDEREKLAAQYEQELGDAAERFAREKETSAMLEKECMRLQAEVEALSFKLAKRPDAEGDPGLDKTQIFGSELAKQLSQVIAQLSGIKHEFTGDYSEIFAVPYAITGEGFSVTTGAVPAAGALPTVGGALPVGELGSDAVFEENVAAEDKPTFTEDKPLVLKKKHRAESEAPEIQAAVSLTDENETPLEQTLINAARAEAHEDFEHELFRSAKEAAARGDDLIATNPAVIDKGQDLAAENPELVDKGEDLSEELYELYSGGGDEAIPLNAFAADEDDDHAARLDKLGFSGALQDDDIVSMMVEPSPKKDVEDFSDDDEMSTKGTDFSELLV